MRLVYKATQAEVKVGDIVAIRGEKHKVVFFRPPHKSSSEGHVTVAEARIKTIQTIDRIEFYVSIIGAEWIEREDRQE